MQALICAFREWIKTTYFSEFCFELVSHPVSLLHQFLLLEACGRPVSGVDASLARRQRMPVGLSLWILSRVSQSEVLKLFGELFNDSERSSIAKDESILLQTLQLFLQQHQDIRIHNVICNDQSEITRHLLDYNNFRATFNHFLSQQSDETTVVADPKEMKKQSIPSEMPWQSSTRIYPETYAMMSGKMRNPKPGKPTVLTTDEERILADFILRLEKKQMRIPREDVGKLVMGILQAMNRPHPFKDDGPHRHWFNGFFKRNPAIQNSRKVASPVSREQLKDNQIEQFLDEIKRLSNNNLIAYAANHLQYAVLDETGYHFNFNSDLALNPVPAGTAGSPSFITNGVQVGKTAIPSSTIIDMSKEKPHRKTWSTEELAWAVEEVNARRQTIKDVSDRTGIPVATIRNHCRNPQMGARRGPPTVLKPIEEAALERFLLKLDDYGYKANKEQLAKIVMELVTSDKRSHPFKEDGPHRHWFDVVVWSESHCRAITDVTRIYSPARNRAVLRSVEKKLPPR